MLERNQRIDKHKPCDFRRRFGVLISVVAFAFFVIIVRLSYLQIINGDELRRRSENNRIRIQEIKPLRGLVKDTNGDVLVDNQPSFDISIVPEDAGDVEAVVERLEGVCEKQVSYNKSSLAGLGKSFVPVKLYSDIERDKLAAIESNCLELPGVVTGVVPIRRYIYGEMMAHILGYVGEISDSELRKDPYGNYKSDDIVGKYGIEKHMDSRLKGESGGRQVEVDVTGRKLRVLGKVDSVPGCNIVLTIDSKLQKVCWDAFKEKAGSVTVMDPRDGSILAMVSKPAFDPNLFNRGISEKDWEVLSADPLSPMQNKAISGQYPPGSTYKLIVAAAALEEGLITPQTSFFCNGSYVMGDRTFRCWKRSGHGKISLHRAITESCDVYFYNVGNLIGVDKLAQYTRGFGFGYKTGMDFSGEERSGLVPTKEWKLNRLKKPWQKGETTSLSIGQGFILATPLQILKAYCAIANGGTLYRPRLVKCVQTAKGQIVEEFPPVKEAVIPVSKKNLGILKRALWGVCNEVGGTGTVLRRSEKDVCGKTGTAQVVSLSEDMENMDERKIPYMHRDHALFICFAPCDNPEIAVSVVVEHGGHGGTQAALVARDVINWYFGDKQKINNIEAKSQ